MQVRGLTDAASGTNGVVTGRTGERTHLFLDATMTLGTSSVRVRVRNLSPTGALIEGPMEPEIGATVTLNRGALVVAGRTMWVAPGRCGIRFDAPVAVADWMPVKTASRHSPEASAIRVPHAPIAAPFDPAKMALDRKAAAPGAVTDRPAATAESGPTQTVQALKELVSLQSDMLETCEELRRSGFDNRAELEALMTAIKRIEGIAMILRKV